MKADIVIGRALIAGILIAISMDLIAGSLDIPHEFIPGTTAKASEVNANFDATEAAIDDNDARLLTIESTVGGADLTPTGNLVLEPSTAIDTGNILKGTTRFIHNFGMTNTFVGENAGNFTMSGFSNTATGAFALQSTTTGARNTASGKSALLRNTSGSSNTATGESALLMNTTGFSNTAVGAAALRANTEADNNTAVGTSALFGNTTGNNNTAHGAFTLVSNTTGDSNTAVGISALQDNVDGRLNTAIGANALFGNTSGVDNTASGVSALESNTTGSNNTAVGHSALRNNTSGNSNIAIGVSAGSDLTTGNNNIAIGNPGVAGESNVIRIGSSQIGTFIAGIRGAIMGGQVHDVFIDDFGRLGIVPSSRELKDNIRDMGESSRVLMKLRPVTFYYKSDRNLAGRTLQYGLIAEEVAQVAPGLVAHSADGKVETVYYRFLAPMLLNEYQKQQRMIEKQSQVLAAQAARIATLEQARQAQLMKLEQQTAHIAALEKQVSEVAALRQRAGLNGRAAR